MKLNRFTLTALLTTSAILLSEINFHLPLQAEQAAWTQGVMLAQSSNPAISTNTIYYDIVGSTAAQLRDQMNQKGPLDSPSGRRYDGYTRWYVRLHYRYSNNNNSCGIGSVDVKTDVNITLPRWKMSSNASRDLVNRWNRYIAALQLHENGHKQHGIDASNEILQTLKVLPTAANCNQMGVIANQAGNRIIKKYAQQDIIYDQTTRHGVTQGAVFP